MNKENAEVESGMNNVVSDVEAQVRATQDAISGNEFLKTSCGDAGTSAIDLYTGRLLFVVPLFQDQVGMTPNLVYNSDYRDEVQQGTNFGNGWRLDVLACISSDSNYNPVYIDGMGTKHLFHRNRGWVTRPGTTQFNTQVGLSEFASRNYRAVLEDSSSIFSYMTDEQYVLSSGSGYSEIKIGDNIIWNATTDSVGCTNEIRNKETGITTTYEYSNNRLSKITCDEVTIDLIYNGSGQVSSIKKTRGGKSESVSITYNSSRISKIARSGGKAVNITYFGSFLNEVLDQYNVGLRFAHSSSYTTNVKQIRKKSSTTYVYGNDWDINYYRTSGNYTKVVDRNGYRVNYVFDQNGRLICQGEVEGNTLPFTINRGTVSMSQQLSGILSGNLFHTRTIVAKADISSVKLGGTCFSQGTTITGGGGSRRLSSGTFTQLQRGKLYVFCCWAKATSLSGTVQLDIDERAEENLTKPYFGARAIVKDSSGNALNQIYVPFDETKTGWQMVAVPVPYFKMSGAGGPLNGVELQFDYSRNSGTAEVRGIFYQTDGECSISYGGDYSIAFDGDHNIVTLNDEHGRPWRSFTRENGSTSRIGEVREWHYDYINESALSYSSPASIVDEYGRTTSYTYNDKRQCTKEETTNGSLKMKTERTYSGGLVTSEEDERGNANNYTHDSYGFTTKVVSPNGSGNSYTYSNFDLSKVTAVKDSTIKNSISYANGRISKVVDDEVEYQYNYDDFGKVTRVLRGPAGVGASEIKSVTYDEFNSSSSNSLGVVDAVTKVSVEYANGYENASFYDNAGRLLQVKEGTAVKETCTYLADGTLSQRIDNYSGMTYTYSESGNSIIEDYQKGSEQILTVSHYDDTAKMKRLVYSHSGGSDPYTQKTDDFGRMTELVTPLGTYTYTYDGLGRVTAKTLKSGSVTVAKETYLYTESSDSGYTSPEKNRITYKDNSWDGYTRDGNGLIKIIVHSPGANLRTYKYDGMNRLIRENIKGHKTATYEYDKAGNLTCRKEYDYHTMSLDDKTPNKTVTYTYQNGRMTSYDGESCVYDENGNPTTYRGKTLTWTRGRLLETYPSLASPNVTWTFTYNADGIRVGKSAPGTTTTYGVDGERIVYEKTNGQIKRYFYDESGIAGFEYSGQKYVFRKNLQGDVVGICNSSGTLIGEYVYDAWGNLLEEPTNDVLLANPFRYRGYYYDTSIGLYYLNSRYYDPETGRFLNEDLVSYLEPETIGGINLYAYCLNDPVNNIDPSGHVVISLLIALAVTGAVVGGAAAGLIASSNGVQGWELAGSIFGGALLGGAIGALVGLGLPMIGGTAGGALAIAGGGTLAMAGAGVAASAVSVSLAGIAGIASILGIGLLFSKHNPGMSNKPPVSWTDIDEGIDIYNKFNGNSDRAAEYLLNKKYGPGNWSRGAGSEFNALKKWFDRIIRFRRR